MERAQDHPHRHGCLLRLRGAARRSRVARQAGGGGVDRAALGGVRGVLRGAQVRGALGHAGGARRAAVSGRGVRAAGLHPLPRGVAPCARNPAAAYGSGGAAVAGRGLPGRDRAQAEPALGYRRRPGHPRQHPRGAEPDRLGGRGAQQVPGQDRVRLEQAGRPVRDQARAGPGFPGALAGGAHSGRRKSDGIALWDHMGVRTVGRAAQARSACIGRGIRPLRPPPVRAGARHRRGRGGRRTGRCSPSPPRTPSRPTCRCPPPAT